MTNKVELAAALRRDADSLDEQAQKLNEFMKLDTTWHEENGPFNKAMRLWRRKVDQAKKFRDEADRLEKE